MPRAGEAGDEKIRGIAGHGSKQILKHYSHIGQQAKRRVVDSLVKKPAEVVPLEQVSNEVGKESGKVEVLQ